MVSGKGYCAQIVPVKVKYFQTFPNKTKNADRITYRFKMLKINEIQNFRILV